MRYVIETRCPHGIWDDTENELEQEHFQDCPGGSRRVVEPIPIDATQHLCGDIHEDEFGFFYAECSAGDYRTMPVPDRELLIDEMMGHAVDAALAGLVVIPDLE